MIRDTQPAPEWVLVDARVILDIDLAAVPELQGGLEPRDSEGVLRVGADVVRWKR